MSPNFVDDEFPGRDEIKHALIDSQVGLSRIVKFDSQSAKSLLKRLRIAVLVAGGIPVTRVYGSKETI